MAARLRLATGLAFAALASPIVARQATETKQTFRTGIDAVTVDVSVIDSVHILADNTPASFRGSALHSVRPRKESPCIV